MIIFRVPFGVVARLLFSLCQIIMKTSQYKLERPLPTWKILSEMSNFLCLFSGPTYQNDLSGCLGCTHHNSYGHARSPYPGTYSKYFLASTFGTYLLSNMLKLLSTSKNMIWPVLRRQWWCKEYWVCCAPCRSNGLMLYLTTRFRQTYVTRNKAEYTS